MYTPGHMREFTQDAQETVYKVLANVAKRKAQAERDNKQKGA